MNLKHKNRAWCVVQHLNTNYIHVETPQVENYNNNDYEQFKSQAAKQARPTSHTCAHTFFSIHNLSSSSFQGQKISIKSFPLS